MSGASNRGKTPLWPFEPWPDYWPYWTRMYEATAKRLWEKGEMHAADDIATLVMGLVEYERDEEILKSGL